MLTSVSRFEPDNDQPELDPVDPADASARNEQDIVAPARAINQDSARAAARQLLLALGAREGSEVAQQTPRRMVEALTQMLTIEPWSFTTFPNVSEQHELVVVRAIPFTSLCEHHVLPFQGVADVGYLPADRLPGLSKIARTVETFARSLQVQEDLGQEIAEFLTQRLACTGVAVVLSATHACMSCRGVRAGGTSTVTLATRGLLSQDSALLDRFLSLRSLPDVSAPPPHLPAPHVPGRDERTRPMTPANPLTAPHARTGVLPTEPAAPSPAGARGQDEEPARQPDDRPADASRPIRHAIAIVSGGLDSTTLAYWLAQRAQQLTLISVNYGQRHDKELQFAARTASALAAQHHVVDLTSLTCLLNGSALTDPSVAVPDGHYTDATMASTVVPNRNALLLDLATAAATAAGADTVAFGAHGGDHAVYPDCRPQFLAAYGRMAQVGGEGFLTDGFQVIAPFLTITKADIVGIGTQLGVPFTNTWSCYRGQELHCGTCGTCVERREAFQVAGVADPTPYQSAGPLQPDDGPPQAPWPSRGPGVGAEPGSGSAPAEGEQ